MGRVEFLGGVGGGDGNGVSFVFADKEEDGNFDPLTSTDWDGDAKALGTGTINWNTDFGVPEGARGVYLYGEIIEETAGVVLAFKAKSTTSYWQFVLRTLVADSRVSDQGLVPIAVDGTSYWRIWDEIDNVYIRVVGWWI